MKDEGRYVVVFRYTKEAGGYHGVITWTSYPSEEEFNQAYTPEMATHQEVVEKGVTQERAIELTRQTPFACRIAAARQEATDDDGEFNPFIFQMELDNAIFAEMEDRKETLRKRNS